jgi:hypothetical protein
MLEGVPKRPVAQVEIHLRLLAEIRDCEGRGVKDRNRADANNPRCTRACTDLGPNTRTYTETIQSVVFNNFHIRRRLGYQGAEED